MCVYTHVFAQLLAVSQQYKLFTVIHLNLLTHQFMSIRTCAQTNTGSCFKGGFCIVLVGRWVLWNILEPRFWFQVIWVRMFLPRSLPTPPRILYMYTWSIHKYIYSIHVYIYIYSAYIFKYIYIFTFLHIHVIHVHYFYLPGDVFFVASHPFIHSQVCWFHPPSCQRT